MTNDEERPEWIGTVMNPWFIVSVFIAGYGIAYLYHLRETVAYWYRWLRRED